MDATREGESTSRAHRRRRTVVVVVVVLLAVAIVCVVLGPIIFPTRQMRLRRILDPSHVTSITGTVLGRSVGDRVAFTATPAEVAEFIGILKELPPKAPCNCPGVGILQLRCTDGDSIHVIVGEHTVGIGELAFLRNDGRLNAVFARVRQRVTTQASSPSSGPAGGD